MKRVAVVAVLTLLPALGACYHVTVETGLTPGSEVIHRPWAHSFVYGLVPPDTVEAMEECEGGVARVESQLSFLNGLVGALTWGIFTPMDILVTCAAGGEDDDLDRVQDAESFERALESGEPFLVELY